MGQHVSAGLEQCINLLQDAVELEQRKADASVQFVVPQHHATATQVGTPHPSSRDGGDWDGAPDFGNVS